MSSKTKIVVLHMKEIIYTVIFLVLTIVILCLMYFMFLSKSSGNTGHKQNYIPGSYHESVPLENLELDIEVSVDSDAIRSIRISNLDENITSRYPMLRSSFEDVSDQIMESQSVNNLKLSPDTPYTSQILINGIRNALKKAVVSKTTAYHYSKINLQLQDIFRQVI